MYDKNKHYTLGIDLGASSVKLVALLGGDEARGKAQDLEISTTETQGFGYVKRRTLCRLYKLHKGNVAQCLYEQLEVLQRVLLGKGYNFDDCIGICLTGSAANIVAEHGITIPVIGDVPALTRGAALLAPRALSIAAIGGQTACYIVSRAEKNCATDNVVDNSKEDSTISTLPDEQENPFNANPAQRWLVNAPDFEMNDSCAAGTGSFFEDQMQRLGLSIEDYSSVVAKTKSIPRLSGRCAVFAKTDIIHRQQEGVAVEDILLGLSYALIRSYKSMVVRGLPERKPLLLAGGVVHNAGVIRAIKDVFNLADDELFASEDTALLQAYGAASVAQAHMRGKDVTGAACASSNGASSNDAGSDDAGSDGASSNDAGSDGAVKSAPELIYSLQQALLGSVKQQTLPRLHPLADEGYLPGVGYSLREVDWEATSHNPIACFLGVDVGSTSTNLVLLDQSHSLLDAQYLRTRGDAKLAVREGLTSLKERLDGKIRILAVGVTGSGRTRMGEFIGADTVRDEITAQAQAAAEANNEVDTVFEIGGQDSKYISLKSGQVADFQMNKICAAGTGSFIEEQALRLAIPLNEYGALAFSSQAPVDLGERCTVFVETAINAALSRGAEKQDIAAGLALSIVRNYLHKVVGSKPVGSHVVLQGGVAYNPAIVAAFRQFLGDRLTVSPWFAVSGAVGAALLAEQDFEKKQRSGKNSQTSFRGFDLSGKAVQNKSLDPAQIALNRKFFQKTEEFYLEGYDSQIDPGKKTVGIPRCLMLHKLFPLANAFFKTLGYNVQLSDASHEQTIALAQQLSQGEVCYPVKLLYGHMEQLARKNVDYIFMPHMHTIRHVMSKVDHNYACPYMQAAPLMVARVLGLENRGIELISPLMDMDFGQQALANALLGVGKQLGHTPQESARAMMAGGFAVQEFTRKTEALGEELLNSLDPNERVLVIITRQYNTADPALNMGIANALIDRGQKVITVSHLHAHDLDISQDYPHMYWPFGQHLLSGAKLVRRDPRLFAVYLTNHGCGPDTMVSHLFAEEMGDKPYLHIEMDEHFSQVGIITRIEAFLNALDNYQTKDESTRPQATKTITSGHDKLDRQASAALLSVGPYGPLVGEWLARQGAQVSLAKMGTSQSLSVGRAEVRSKEYYSFVLALGAVLQAVEGNASDNTNSILSEQSSVQQILMPSSEGAEADGVYDRVVRSILDAKGYTNVRLIAPSLEKLPWLVHDTDQLFLMLIAGDLYWAAHYSYRSTLMKWLLKGPFTFERVLEAAKRAKLSWLDQESSEEAALGNKVLGVVGEWWLVCDDELMGKVGAKLEEAQWRLWRMPLAEYLLFSWYDAAKEDAVKRSRTPFFLDQVSTGGGSSCLLRQAKPNAAEQENLTAEEQADLAAKEQVNLSAAKQTKSVIPSSEEPSFEEKRTILAEYASKLSKVHHVLGVVSPYEDDLDSLKVKADSLLGEYRGANGRYRAAKMENMAASAKGVIAVSSLYENTDTVLRLLERKVAAPVLHLSFDGTLEQGLQEKLDSFLYYL